MALTRPFAQNGDKLAIPETASDSSVSYNLGFTYAYALPPEEGGKFIDRAQFNQLMYDTTSQVIANTTAIATKANANATVNLSENQNINGVKTFTAPPVSATNPTNNNQVANKAYVDSVGNTAVKLTGNQTIQGTKTFNNDIVSPNITAMQNNLNSIFSSTSTPVTYLKTGKVITVGNSGADFTDLLSAVKKAATYTNLVEVRLISNLTVNSGTLISGLNGKNITINFNNFKISSSDRSLGFVFERSFINELIDVSLEKHQLFFSNTIGAISGNITINNPDSYCISAGNNAIMTIRSESTINLITKDNGPCFYLYSGSIVSAINCTINDNSDYTTGRTFEVLGGTLISLIGSTINSPQSRPFANLATNTLTSNGIIFK